MLVNRQTLLLLSGLFMTNVLGAQSVNWAADIAPILYNHCSSCHRDGGIGGFSLIGYDNAFNQRESILSAVTGKRMPPWKADPTYRHFKGENILTADQIQKITDWVTADGPAGNLADAPAEPVFLDGSSLGIPDEVLFTPAYTMTATEDEYRCFVLPSGLLENKFLRGLEVLPGNHAAVHHVLIYEDKTGQAKQLDAQTPEPGYISFGGTGVQGTKLIGAWVPGNRPFLLPPFMGIPLAAGSDLVVQVHFPGSATGLSDMSRLNLFFTPTNQNVREVSITPVINHSPLSMENGPLIIPANTTRDFKASYNVPVDVTLIGVGPHMHLIGRSIKSFGITQLQDTIPLVNIPEWDFHWQGFYQFQKAQKVPAGTKIEAFAHYDNTSNNPFNPSNPPKLVTVGEATTDEMMLIYFTYMLYKPGDENIVFDSTLLSSATPVVPFAPKVVTGMQVSPNPVGNGPVTISYQVEAATEVSIRICNLYGGVIRTLPVQRHQTPGIYQQVVEAGQWPQGGAFVQVLAPNGTGITRQVVHFKTE